MGTQAVDPLDVTLVDDDLLIETSLTVDLIVAATESPDGALSQDRIDTILGLGPAQPAVHGQRPSSPAPRLLRYKRQPA